MWKALGVTLTAVLTARAALAQGTFTSSATIGHPGLVPPGSVPGQSGVAETTFATATRPSVAR